MSILVDSSYASLLILAAVLFGLDKLNDVAFLAITILIHAFLKSTCSQLGFRQ